jgi:DNA sulfur modification protein DndE
MNLTKLRVTRETSNLLRALAGRTGLTPNLLCRLGFCLSLNEPSIPNPDDYPEEDREFNRYTLLGEYDDFFIALLRQRCHQDGLAPSQLADYFRAHINRGVAVLQVRLKRIGDLASLVTSI